MKTTYMVLTILSLVSLLGGGCRRDPREVERPERILSKREVYYDSSTYAKLAQLWKKYDEVYPSEDAYANWMYAARYADDPNYLSLLNRGLETYPSNPVLLYLAGHEKQSRQDNLEGLQLMERAAAMDPTYMDPWHGLVVAYLAQGDREKLDMALRRLLEGGAVEDAIMDFSYNMIASLDTNAILITNGDNDTFPGWILTRITRYRRDVNIVNRALLNTKWYPSAIIEEGAPSFITQSGIDSLKTQTSADIEKAKSGQLPGDKVTLLGDRLVMRLIDAAERVGRPVYFACTLDDNDMVKKYMMNARRFGLVSLVTPEKEPYKSQLQKLFRTWGNEYRTGGLDSWRLHAAKETRADRMLVRNYATALHSLSDRIEEAGPVVQLSLFHWYRNHLIDLIPKGYADDTNRMWGGKNSPREIKEWCKIQGLAE